MIWMEYLLQQAIKNYLKNRGRASFSMEFLKYAEVPNNIAEQLKTT